MWQRGTNLSRGRKLVCSALFRLPKTNPTSELESERGERSFVPEFRATNNYSLPTRTVAAADRIGGCSVGLGQIRLNTFNYVN